jgi:uncharacterized membrane protein YeaQ/YmgE (transglycosylase-associated protein family)
MEDQAIGWIAAIIIGGIAGWLAEQVMKSQMGLLMNIVLGIVGAAIASWLFGLVGISFGPGWLGYLIAGFIGAVILISSYGRSENVRDRRHASAWALLWPGLCLSVPGAERWPRAGVRSRWTSG